MEDPCLSFSRLCLHSFMYSTCLQAYVCVYVSGCIYINNVSVCINICRNRCVYGQMYILYIYLWINEWILTLNNIICHWKVTVFLLYKCIHVYTHIYSWVASDICVSIHTHTHMYLQIQNTFCDMNQNVIKQSISLTTRWK